MLYFMQPDKFPSHSKLETFRHLPAGWHYGKGGPISADAINRAKHVVDTLAINGFTHTDVFPNEGGEVLVTAYHQEHYLSVTVEEQGYTLNHERAGNDVSFAESLDCPTLSKSLNKIAREIWNMSGFLHPWKYDHTTGRFNDLAGILASRVVDRAVGFGPENRGSNPRAGAIR